MPGQAMDSYEEQAAARKEEILWDKIKETKYQQLPTWSGKEILPLIFKIPIEFIIRKYLKVTVELESDFFPECRTKVIHTYGAVCPIKFISNNSHDFTGVFSGIEHGFIRLSLAKKPDESKIIPGAAIKFLLDGIPSVNFMAMASLEGQSEFNFFEYDFSNFVEEPKSLILKILARAFATVSKDPNKVDVSDLFRVMPNGEKVQNPKIASKLKLVPNREFKFLEASHEVRDDLLTRIPAGSILYEVYACDVSTSNETPIGSIVTKDKFICSKFGDAQLFFRHQRFDRDRENV
jgi:hypothetical protein